MKRPFQKFTFWFHVFDNFLNFLAVHHATNEDPKNMYALEFCKHNIGPTEEVALNWEICYQQRKNLLKDTVNIVEYFNNFPILKHPQHGYQFLMDDFLREYPDKGENLYKNWPQLRSAVLKIMEEDKIKPKFDDDMGKKY